MSAATILLIVILILLMMIRRQLTPRPLSIRLVYVPLILLILAFYQANDIPNLGGGNWASFMISMILGLIVGAIAGSFTRVYEHNGQWIVVGSMKTLGIWILSIPLRFGVRMVMNSVFHVAALPHNAQFVPYLFSLAGIFLGQIIMVLMRNPRHMGTIFTQQHFRH